MEEIFIWWLDKWHRMAADMVLEEAERANLNTPVLAGHLKLALRHASGQEYRGQLVPPVTLDYMDRDYLHNSPNFLNTDLGQILSRNCIGIPFESVHLNTVKQYPGIITTREINAVSAGMLDWTSGGR